MMLSHTHSVCVCVCVCVCAMCVAVGMSVTSVYVICGDMYTMHVYDLCVEGTYCGMWVCMWCLCGI